MLKGGLRILAPAAIVASGLTIINTDAKALTDCGSGGSTIAYNYTGSIFTCEIVSSGNYDLTAFGANGGDQRIDALAPTTFGGIGAYIDETYSLLFGDVLQLLVGGVGQTHAGELLSGEIYAGGGGGGTFISIQRNGGPITPLLVAGGGGGAGTASAGRNGLSVDGDAGQNGDGQYSNAGKGGTGGSGGGGTTTATGGAGGGGFYGDGGTGPSSTGGKSFLDGGAGGTAYPAEFCFGASGGFGGGGGAAWSDCTQSGGPGAGGGGGYSGGGGGGWAFLGNDGGAGGGGTSYYTLAYGGNVATVQLGYHPFASGDGMILIQQLTREVELPEPGSLAVLGTGLAALVLRHRRARAG